MSVFGGGVFLVTLFVTFHLVRTRRAALCFAAAAFFKLSAAVLVSLMDKVGPAGKEVIGLYILYGFMALGGGLIGSAAGVFSRAASEDEDDHDEPMA